MMRGLFANNEEVALYTGNSYVSRMNASAMTVFWLEKYGWAWELNLLQWAK
jgi:hypothetical protein